MGYTHYWRQQRAATEAEWTALCEATRKIIAVAPGEVRDLYHAQTSRLTICGPLGAGAPEISVDAIALNGEASETKDLSHESFVLTRAKGAKRDYETDADYAGGSFDFCKTASKPYDVVVVAILCVTGKVAPGVWKISSDGDAADWKDGLALASAALGEPVEMPMMRD